MLDILNYKAKPFETIKEHTEKVMKNAHILYKMGYINEKIYFLLKESCKYHDYGKCNAEFQKRIEASENGKFIRFDEEKEVGHNILSLLFVDRTIFSSVNDYYKVCLAILKHHHYVDNYKALTEGKKLINKFANEFNLKNLGVRTIDGMHDEEKNGNESRLLLGLLNRCDYAGSSNEFQVEYENNFLKNAMNKFIEKNNFSWNELQEYTYNNRDKNMIVVANTGMGKTEAGLRWIGNNKGFFILPLKTAINAMYERIKNGILENNVDNKLILLHSDSLEYCLSNEVYVLDNDIFKYINIGKNLAMPLTISTLDQIFNFVFQYKGYESKLATLSYSKVVIDEIQAYSPDLIAYIFLGLKNIVDVGGKFLIMTATFPPFLRFYLEKEIGHIEYKTFVEGKTRHNVKIYDDEINSKIIYEHFLEKNGKVLVVCNTVKKAQLLYDELKELDLGIDVELLHSKFIKRDREKKEISIKEFGETNVLGNKIWISTQIVEASLDIDFDYLFTELSDLNGLFQRMGRVNRKGKKDDLLLDYNVFVFTKINNRLFINDDKGFIDKKIFELSKRALSEIDGLLTEIEKYNLVEDNLTYKNIKESEFDKLYKNIYEYTKNMSLLKEIDLKEVKHKFRNILTYKIIPKSVYEENYDIIVKLIENLTNGNYNVLDKTKLDSYTLNVYNYENYNKYKIINLKYEKIAVLNCEYTYEKGFLAIKREKIKEEHENIF